MDTVYQSEPPVHYTLSEDDVATLKEVVATHRQGGRDVEVARIVAATKALEHHDLHADAVRFLREQFKTEGG